MLHVQGKKRNMISYFVALSERKLIVATSLYSISYIMGDAFICERGATTFHCTFPIGNLTFGPTLSFS